MDSALAADIADLCGAEITEEDGGVRVGTIFVRLGDPDAWFDPVLKDLMPRSPRGDYRERTVNLLVRDAIEDTARISESELFEPEYTDKDGVVHTGAFFDYSAITDPDMRPAFGAILADHYVIETAGKTKFLFPFQTDLPGNYVFNGRYKLFNGLILAFFAKPGTADGYNQDLLASFYGLFNDNASLSLLEQQALEIARKHAERGDPARGRVDRVAEPKILLDSYRDELESDVFFPELHERLIQADIVSALRMQSMGRKDRVNAVLQVFYFHLALYFWRAGYVLEEQASLFERYLGGDSEALDALHEASATGLEDSSFRRQIKFRVATTRPRTVSSADACASSFRELNNRRLLLLPANLSLLGTSRKFLGLSAPATFETVARELDGDAALAKGFDCACRIAATEIAFSLDGQQRDDLIQTTRNLSEPGFVTLRTALLKRWRRDLRRSSTDITAGLMRRGGKGISATRGSVQYFELGQDLLLLLAKLVAGDEAVRYGDFLERLSLYGLCPQDGDEEVLLAEVLRSLQLLEKYSDTGEAMYVKHFL